MSWLMLRLLIDRINEGNGPRRLARRVQVPSKLIERKSAGPAPRPGRRKG